MDALALLCNLYGDGPSTLQRLRAHGIQGIEDLAGRTPAEVSSILSLPVAGARRFLKEAAALKQRVLVGEVARVESRAEPQPLPKPVRPKPREVTRGKRAMLAAAARRWTELDRSEAEADLASAPSSARAPQTTPSQAPGDVPPARRATPLQSADLDRSTFDALRTAGVGGLEELIELEAETLAAASGLGLSQVLFVQGLARRRLRDEPAPAVVLPSPALPAALRDCTIAPGPAAEVRFSPSERPPRDGIEESGSGEGRSPGGPPGGPPGDSAGPFA